MASRPDPVLGPAFGAVLRRERERLALSQRAVADYCGDLSRGRLSQLENGLGGSPTLRTIRRIAAAFGMRSSELLALVEAYAAAPGAAQGGDAEDRRAPAVDADPPAPPDGPDSRWPAGVPFTFTHPTAGTQTGDSLSPGITRVEDLTA